MRKLPPFRRAFSVPNVLSTIAVLAALGGTAYAATVVTGANVRDSTLTSADFKNLSLTATDFTASTVTAVKVTGDKGAPGDIGPTGDVGPVGFQGPKGDAGNPAPRAYTFLTKAQHSRVKSGTSNPPGSIFTSECKGLGDDPFGCTGANSGSPYRYPRWSFRCLNKGDVADTHCFTGGTSAPQLTRSLQPVMVSSQQAGGGLLVLPYDGTIVLNASATFYTQITPVMQRVSCQLEIARVENGVPQAPQTVGTPMSSTRFLDGSSRTTVERLLTLSVTGATDQPAGTYETQLSCHSPDDTGQSTRRIEFIEGNLSVFSTRSNG